MHGVQLHQVVAGRDQVPLVGGLLQPAQQHEFALPGVNLTEHRLHDRFAPRINGAAPLRLQLPGHALLQRRICWDPTPGNLGNTFAVLHPAGRDEKLRPAVAARFNTLRVVQVCC